MVERSEFLCFGVRTIFKRGKVIEPSLVVSDCGENFRALLLFCISCIIFSLELVFGTFKSYSTIANSEKSEPCILHLFLPLPSSLINIKLFKRKNSEVNIQVRQHWKILIYSTIFYEHFLLQSQLKNAFKYLFIAMLFVTLF